MPIPKKVSVAELMAQIRKALAYRDPHRISDNPFEQRLHWHGNEAQRYVRAELPPSVRLRLIKRVVLRILRVYTHIQELFNYNTLQYLLNVNAKANFLANRLETGQVQNRERIQSLETSMRQTMETLHVGLQDVRALSERVDAMKSMADELMQSERRLIQIVSDARLTERVAMLERERRFAPAADAVASPPPSGKLNYLLFENSFRGSQEEIRQRHAQYLPKMAGAGRVLDLGCGRGEFLELMRDNGIDACGVDVDPGMVAICREKGLQVEQAELLAFLRNTGSTWDTIFTSQVVEHLALDNLIELIQLAYDRLNRAGVFIAETPNPQNLMIYAGSFVMDPTHVRPLHPATLSLLLLQSGFVDITIEYRTPSQEKLPLVDKPETPLESAYNVAMNRLNAILFTHQDYAAIGRKPK